MVRGECKYKGHGGIKSYCIGVGVELCEPSSSSAEERGGEHERRDRIDTLTYRGYVIVMQTAVCSALSGPRGLK